MFHILDRGHSVPTVTEFIFVRAQCLTIFIKACCTSWNNNWIQLLFREVQHTLQQNKKGVISEGKNCHVNIMMIIKTDESRK
jgi:hypothetical protein